MIENKKKVKKNWKEGSTGLVLVDQRSLTPLKGNITVTLIPGDAKTLCLRPNPEPQPAEPLWFTKWQEITQTVRIWLTHSPCGS